MNNTFNIKRFGLVFRKDLIENGRRYLLLFLTMFGLITVLITYQTWGYYEYKMSTQILDDSVVSSHSNGFIFGHLSVLFFVFGIWFASTFSNPINSKLKRLSFFINPSSNLEKYLSRWLLTTVGFILAFFVALAFADILMVAICSVRFPDADIQFIDFNKFVAPSEQENYREFFIMRKIVFTLLIGFYFLIQSIFLLGSTIWEKASFIKTFTAGVVIVAVFSLLCRWTLLLLYGNPSNFENVINSFEWDETTSPDKALSFVIAVFAVFTLTNWILAYFRLKESEIIKRL